MLRRWVHGTGAGDDPLVRFAGATVADSVRFNLYADERGSIVMRTDSAGTPIGAIYKYDAYGAPSTTTGLDRFAYTGQVWLPDVGVYHYKARMYDPRLGRFLQTDPIGYGDGMNLYAYVGNDPVNFVDPTGLSSVDCKPGEICIVRDRPTEDCNACLYGEAATAFLDTLENLVNAGVLDAETAYKDVVIVVEEEMECDLLCRAKKWWTTPRKHDISGTAICWKACGPNMIDPIQEDSPAEQAATLAALGVLVAGPLLAPEAPGALAASRTFGLTSSRFGSRFYRGGQAGSWNRGPVRVGWTFNKNTGRIYFQPRAGDYHIPSPISVRPR